jgi:hypothetical protein
MVFLALIVLAFVQPLRQLRHLTTVDPASAPRAEQGRACVPIAALT